MTPGAAIALGRQRAGISRRDLAARSGTSPATLIAYETGRVQPSFPVLERILHAAGQDLVLEVVRRQPVDEAARDRELVSVLRLAAQFPSRHPRTWRAPVFPHR